MKNIRQGNIIKGLNWPEPVEIKLIEETEGYIHIVGVTTISQSHVDQLISQEEFLKLCIVGTEITCSEDPGKVFLALEATRYRFASLYDPLLAMNTSKIDPLPHQIEAVYGYVLKLPRIRFLIADDPGAGKTIMAGLVIKELKLRSLIKRVLIVTPGHLKDQGKWREHRFWRALRDCNLLKFKRNIKNSTPQNIKKINNYKGDRLLSGEYRSDFNIFLLPYFFSHPSIRKV